MSEASPAYQRHSMMRPGQMFADQADVCWPCQAASRKLGCWFSVRLGIKQSRYWDKEAEWNMACCLVLTTMSWLLSIFHTVACEDDDLMQCRWVINILWQRPGGKEGPVIVTHSAELCISLASFRVAVKQQDPPAPPPSELHLLHPPLSEIVAIKIELLPPQLQAGDKWRARWWQEVHEVFI